MATRALDGIITPSAFEERQYARDQRRSKLLRQRRRSLDVGERMKRLLAEGVGTSFILLCGTLIASAGWCSPVVAACWGLAVAIAVTTWAGLSGAHFNPAVTVALAAGSSFPWSDLPAYFAAQYSGAVVAAKAAIAAGLKWPALFPLVAYPGMPCSLTAEVGISAILVYCCLSIGESVEAGRVHKRAAPLLVGLTITLLNLCFGHLGAGINPAMSGAPRLLAALSGFGLRALEGAAAYTLGPILGGLLGGCVFALCSGRGQGMYNVLAQLGRNLSPWYGEHWERVQQAELPSALPEPEPETAPVPDLDLAGAYS